MRLFQYLLLTIGLILGVNAIANDDFFYTVGTDLVFPASVSTSQTAYEDVIVTNNTPDKVPALMHLIGPAQYMDSHVTVVPTFSPTINEPAPCVVGDSLQPAASCTVRLKLDAGTTATTIPAAGKGLLVMCVSDQPTDCSILGAPAVTVQAATDTTLAVDQIVLQPGKQVTVDVTNTGSVDATNVVAALPTVFTGHVTSQTNKCATIAKGSKCEMSFTLSSDAPAVIPADKQVVTFQGDNVSEFDVPVVSAITKVAVTSLDFQNPEVDSILVANMGTVPLTSLSIGALADTIHNVAPPATPGATPCGASLAAGASCNYYYEAKNDAYGTSPVTITYASMAVGTQTATTSVSVAPTTIAINPNSSGATSPIVGDTSKLAGSFTVKTMGAFSWVNASVTKPDADAWLTFTPAATGGCTGEVAPGASCTMDYKMTVPFGLSSTVTATGTNAATVTTDFTPGNFFTMGVETDPSYQHFQYASLYVKNLSNVAVTLDTLTADIPSTSSLSGKIINCDQTGADCDASVISADSCKVGSALAANTGECHIWYKVETLTPSGSDSIPVTVVGKPAGGADSTLTHTYTFGFKNLLVAGGHSNGVANASGDGYLDVWNGTAWEPIGTATDFDGSVKALAFYKGDLYVGGNFDKVGGVANTNLIARWDGKAWHDVDQGLTNKDTQFMSTVNALTVDPTGQTLYAGGHFTDATGVTTLGDIASWNGTAWANVANGVQSGDVYSLAMFGSKLYAGGDFQLVGGKAGKGLAYLDSAAKPAAWTPIYLNPNMSVNPKVYALAATSKLLYIGGEFPAKVGDATYARDLVSYDGTTIAALAGTTTTGSASSTVNSLVTSGDDVYIGGGGFVIGTTSYGSVTMYDGTKFNNFGAVGTMPLGHVNAIAKDAASMFIGQSISTTPQSYAMQWNGTAWSSLGAYASLPGDVLAEILIPQITITT